VDMLLCWDLQWVLAFTVAKLCFRACYSSARAISKVFQADIGIELFTVDISVGNGRALHSVFTILTSQKGGGLPQT